MSLFHRHTVLPRSACAHPTTFDCSCPPAAEPTPVVLWASECSGFFHSRAPWHFLERAQHLVSARYAVAYIDYVSAAGLETACAGELALAEIGQIMMDAIGVLNSSPKLDTGRVVLLGSSLGAGGVLASLSVPKMASRCPIAVLALYPACAGLSS